MSIEALALLMITSGWVMIYFLEKKKEGITKEAFNILCGLSFTLNILGASLCLIALTGNLQ